jgi:isoquinoline 1-oxidoreductase beta subunit
MTHLRTATPAIANLSRRAVLAGSVAGGLVLAMRLPRSALAQARKFAGEGMRNGLRDDPRIFVAIAEDGTVTVTCHRSEMGQGVRTSWPMVIADELDADWARIKVAQAWGDEQHFGNQDTDGSRSMRITSRRCAASARRRARCSRRPRRRSGTCRSQRSRRRTTRWCTPRRAGVWATARWRRSPQAWRCRPAPH